MRRGEDRKVRRKTVSIEPVSLTKVYGLFEIKQNRISMCLVRRKGLTVSSIQHQLSGTEITLDTLPYCRHLGIVIARSLWHVAIVLVYNE